MNFRIIVIALTIGIAGMTLAMNRQSTQTAENRSGEKPAQTRSVAGLLAMTVGIVNIRLRKVL
jgi:hypothetical protein